MASMRVAVPPACSRAMAAVDELPTAFPPPFLAFLHRNGLDASIYAAATTLPRYIRVKPQAYNEIAVIEEELGLKLSPLPWLPGFFSLPPEAQIASTQAYQHGKLYGMDAASGAAVAALQIEAGDHVLDLCAAPGAKLCMMAESLGESGTGTFTAVDIARPRLAACRTMLRKYGLGRRARLYLGDGTTFSLLPLAGVVNPAAHVDDDHSHRAGDEESNEDDDEAPASSVNAGGMHFRRSATTPSRGIIPRRSGTTNSHNTPNCGYNKVLVDAECTHDGSLKHITKYEQWGWETFEKRFLNEERIASITSLQLSLLSNGFRLLDPGGTLIYSTCSFTKDQNEGVLERFLATHGDAELQEVEAARQWPCKAGGLPHTLRFDPVASNTSGLFLAKVKKLGTLEPPPRLEA